jgi:hypothetical protein
VTIELTRAIAHILAQKNISGPAAKPENINAFFWVQAAD